MAKAQIINFTVQSKINGSLYLKRNALRAKRIYILDAILFSVQNCAHLGELIEYNQTAILSPFLKRCWGVGREEAQ